MESAKKSAAEFQLLRLEERIGNGEHQLLTAQLDELKRRWATPRWNTIKRSYTAYDVVTKRGSLPSTYDSSIMGQKLFNLIKKHQAAGSAITTYDTAGRKPRSAYVSGWTCSSLATTTNEVSPDLADYPYNTVPDQVERIWKAEKHHDRKQWDARSKLSLEDKMKTPYKDYLMPIVADGDAGHGGLTTVMKLAKLFAESGAAAFHIEDQLQGAKKCGHLAGKVVVSTSEQIDRLVAARFQLDVMNAELLLMARTDSFGARLINSTVDVRDHEFILGVTDASLSPLAEDLSTMEADGVAKATIDAFESSWLETVRLVTIDEAAVEHLTRHGASQQDIDAYVSEVQTSPNTSMTARRQLVQKLVNQPFYFSCEVPRTREGFYRFRGSLETVTKRLLAFAPYAELLAAETSTPDLAVARQLAHPIKQAYPDRGLVYNLSPSFNWDGVMSLEKLKDFTTDLAQCGYVLQIVALGGFHSTARMIAELSNRFKDEGMLAYVELIQRPERQLKADILTHQKWSGIEYYQGILDSIRSGNSSMKMTGADSTEHQF
ncbi:hypothetical protein M409DRAFT_63734 [Zasmidium cellare ATCC 36951]|uniref:Isocitrate lyase n=1 Tax=Zasmidium cellare ATCC 36951 TaxID=1080233 RepID=A0A6A6CXP6_ZASCE|nr:uncharacterized protein M409DRAFT_63734 [Zasmidium cellare ATCC 36951]KAF2171483.1 hypothetical protein M409DRAFT_63734 [Zasmidium cellare ATCC 36951]